MQATVIIPKKTYELLLKCKSIVESDFEERFSKKFIDAIKKSEKAYGAGQFVRCSSRQERLKLFDSNIL